MKHWGYRLVLGLGMTAAGLGLAWAGIPTPAELDEVATIDTAQVKEAIAGRQTVLIDFRDGFDRALPRALNCPGVSLKPTLDEDEIKRAALTMERCASVTRTDKSKPIIVYCAGIECWSAPKAALVMTRMGFAKVQWYRRGIEGWIADGELVK